MQVPMQRSYEKSLEVFNFRLLHRKLRCKLCQKNIHCSAFPKSRKPWGFQRLIACAHGIVPWHVISTWPEVEFFIAVYWVVYFFREVATEVTEKVILCEYDRRDTDAMQLCYPRTGDTMLWAFQRKVWRAYFSALCLQFAFIEILFSKTLHNPGSPSGVIR